MADLGKILLLGGAAYLAYEFFFAPAAAPATAPAAGPQPATAPTPTANPQTTQQLIQAAAAADTPPFTQGTADQWDVYYSRVRGIAAPDPGSYLTADNRAEIFTFPEWWALASAHGLSGYKASPTWLGMERSY
jgi:CubicO group peptidase (beta-lactamase class C family)